jgi:hypothetical protein
MLAPLVMTLALSSGAAVAGQAADPPDALLALVEGQARRIEALEARLAALQQEVAQLRQPPVTPAVAPPEAPAVPADIDREAKSDLVDHAVGGEAPKDATPEGPQADLPRARAIDGYGSLRVAAALDSEGSREIRNNSSRVGLRGSKRLTDGIQAFGRLEFGVNMVATDRVILSGGDPGAPIGQGSQAVFSRRGREPEPQPAAARRQGRHLRPAVSGRPLLRGDHAVDERAARGGRPRPPLRRHGLRARAALPRDRRALAGGRVQRPVARLGPPPGDFRTRFGLGYVVYNFGGGSRVFGGFKVEDSRRSDGSKRVNSAFAAGLNYTF